MTVEARTNTFQENAPYTKLTVEHSQAKPEVFRTPLSEVWIPFRGRTTYGVLKDEVAYRSYGNPNPTSDTRNIFLGVPGLLGGSQRLPNGDRIHYFERLMPYLDAAGFETMEMDVPGNNTKIDKRGRIVTTNAQRALAGIHNHEVALEAVIRDIAEHNPEQKPINLVPYGHSLGTIAVGELSPEFVQEMHDKGVTIQTVLSCPAFRLPALAELSSPFFALSAPFALLSPPPVLQAWLQFAISQMGHLASFPEGPDEMIENMWRSDPHVALEHTMGLLNNPISQKETNRRVKSASRVYVAEEDTLVDNAAYIRYPHTVLVRNEGHMLERHSGFVQFVARDLLKIVTSSRSSGLSSSTT